MSFVVVRPKLTRRREVTDARRDGMVLGEQGSARPHLPRSSVLFSVSHVPPCERLPSLAARIRADRSTCASAPSCPSELLIFCKALVRVQTPSPPTKNRVRVRPPR